MAKSTGCPRPVIAASCVVKAVKGCENKKHALALLRSTLGKDPSAEATKLYEKAVQGTATSCRITARVAAAKAASEARASAAAETSDSNRFNGLFGLGLIGLAGLAL